MAPPDAFGAIADYVVDCTTDLLAAYRRRVELVEGGLVAAPGQQVMALVGFASPEMRGSLVLLASREVALGLVPEELWRANVPLEKVLRDVTGEFANMLAGRVRNRMLAHGLEPQVTTPTTVLGEGLEAPAAIEGRSTWYRFTGSGVDLFVRFEASFEQGYALPRHDEAQAPSTHEGEMVFF